MASKDSLGVIKSYNVAVCRNKQGPGFLSPHCVSSVSSAKSHFFQMHEHRFSISNAQSCISCLSRRPQKMTPKRVSVRHFRWVFFIEVVQGIAQEESPGNTCFGCSETAFRIMRLKSNWEIKSSYRYRLEGIFLNFSAPLVHMIFLEEEEAKSFAPVNFFRGTGTGTRISLLWSKSLERSLLCSASSLCKLLAAPSSSESLERSEKACWKGVLCWKILWSAPFLFLSLKLFKC